MSTVNKPPIPPSTCPIVDHVIELVDQLDNTEYSSNMRKLINDAIRAELEIIRQANDELTGQMPHPKAALKVRGSASANSE